MIRVKLTVKIIESMLVRKKRKSFQRILLEMMVYFNFDSRISFLVLEEYVCFVVITQIGNTHA